jgi:uroporphyrinogen decarboxylase
VFYYHNLLRSLELSLIDALLRPEFTHCLIQHLSDFFTEYHQRCFEATRGLVHITQVTDDWGSQYGLLTSKKVFTQFYQAATQRAINLAKQYDILVFHHDDGDMRPLLPELVGMGIDILNPIQWRCGNWDLAALKREYGSKICFHSAVDNQETLPFGSPEDVRKEVKMLINTLGQDGTGFIIAPCHNLQPVTPIENILALYAAAHEQ